jgi:hypothetical protein
MNPIWLKMYRIPTCVRIQGRRSMYVRHVARFLAVIPPDKTHAKTHEVHVNVLKTCYNMTAATTCADTGKTWKLPYKTFITHGLCTTPLTGNASTHLMHSSDPGVAEVLNNKVLMFSCVSLPCFVSTASASGAVFLGTEWTTWDCFWCIQLKCGDQYIIGKCTFGFNNQVIIGDVVVRCIVLRRDC